ncbi:MAG: thioredoxin-disulfide reductase [Candidatus Omnitrophota bacterium]
MTRISDDIFDMVIIGGGPAGLTAGLYAARGRVKAVLLESMTVMGQVTMTDAVENYPGVEKVSGFDIISRFRSQAENFGLKCQADTVREITSRLENDIPVWDIRCDEGKLSALSVVIASGASPKKLDIPGEKDFTGRGVSYCATCDGPFFRGKKVVVIGGGDTAVEEALYLTRFAENVTIIHRRDRLRATRILQERAFAEKKINFIWEAVAESITGADKVGKITVKNVKTGKNSDVLCDGIFIFTGWEPNTGFVRDLIKTEKDGSIAVDAEMRTSARGIFAAGDCTKKLLHQIITACGDGATAAFAAQRYVDEIKGVAYK